MFRFFYNFTVKSDTSAMYPIIVTLLKFKLYLDVNQSYNVNRKKYEKERYMVYYVIYYKKIICFSKDVDYKVRVMMTFFTIIYCMIKINLSQKIFCISYIIFIF